MDNEGFRRFFTLNRVRIDASPQAIRGGTSTAEPPRDSVAGNAGVRGLFVNDQLNSRLPTPLGGATFHDSWRAPLATSLRALSLACSTDRIAAFGLSDWVLFDNYGKMIRQGVLRNGELRLDPAEGLFFAPEFSGSIMARRLSDGELAFRLNLLSDKRFFRPFVARHENRLATVSIELHLDMGQPPPERLLMEVTDLKTPSKRTLSQEDGGPVVMADLVRDTNVAHAALLGDNLILATQNRIYGMDLDLTIHRILTGDFAPAALSLDDAGRIYLLAEEAHRIVVSRIDVKGERNFSVTLPPEELPSHPPIVGYDHMIYLPTGESILAIAADGKIAWRRRAEGRLAGAAVTPDGFLLAAEGSQVAAYDSAGKRKTIFEAKDSILTAPVLNGKTLLVATGTGLYSAAAA